MELSSDPAVATLEMSQTPSQDDEPFGGDGGGDYESLPPHVSVTSHMTAGAVAGILEHTVMYPVDSVKTRMQSLQPDPNAQYKGVYQALRRIIQTEGLLRPLRGLNITMMGAGPAHALYFACYERVKRSLSDVMQSGGNSNLANGVAGSVATVLHDAIMNPAEGKRKDFIAPFLKEQHSLYPSLSISERFSASLSVSERLSAPLVVSQCLSASLSVSQRL
ncbi:mitoferrin-1-like [Etheostoma cragini]|uniref:mitoferrin-1-like n=1 Tax=Etheostoma cragini TaxID=417921 RepID=UPI00155E2D08|nr:mitoferrin-1-like [Etheostoma cragini]